MSIYTPVIILFKEVKKKTFDCLSHLIATKVSIGFCYFKQVGIIVCQIVHSCCTGNEQGKDSMEHCVHSLASKYKAAVENAIFVTNEHRVSKLDGCVKMLCEHGIF